MKFCHKDSEKDGLFQGDAKETSKGVAGAEGKMLTLVVLPQDSINANSQKRNGKAMGGDKNGLKISTGKF